MPALLLPASALLTELLMTALHTSSTLLSASFY